AALERPVERLLDQVLPVRAGPEAETHHDRPDGGAQLVVDVPIAFEKRGDVILGGASFFQAQTPGSNQDRMIRASRAGSIARTRTKAAPSPTAPPRDGIPHRGRRSHLPSQAFQFQQKQTPGCGAWCLSPGSYPRHMKLEYSAWQHATQSS